jgi:glutathione synthase/RimK-type ligase-like ATP-grasp enzyme
MSRRDRRATLMARVAYLTGASYRGAVMAPQEVPPAEALELPLLQAACAPFGIDLHVLQWSAPNLVADAFDAALIRSCWDYHERPDAFVAALDGLAARGVRVFNDPAIVRWNARKTYLQELGRRGAPTIDTLWLDSVTPLAIAKAFGDLNAAEIVVKPQVGAGSRRTIRLHRNRWSEIDLLEGPDGPAMVQALLPAIETEGELSIFLFGGQFSHAVRKRPAPGQWFANVDGATFGAEHAAAEVRALAQQVVAAAPPGMVYARVDLVRDLTDQLAVIELEAIEPYLFFAYAPEGAGNLARALDQALKA